MAYFVHGSDLLVHLDIATPPILSAAGDRARTPSVRAPIAPTPAGQIGSTACPAA
jgi:hypothetical protein